ncbi:MAG TPA: hypothetical protein VEK57_16295 [Thermoanaerobaculia bacterium]|nr:hypothetical protein [Thermoanaerobaculia bacterium]
MNARAALIAAAAALLLTAGEGAAEKTPSLTYIPANCIKGGELALMQLRVEGKGELRGYFRRLNTTDWCSVEGVNDGPLSRVVLPKFETGDEVEYFFVLIDGRRVVARSPRIYRAKVNTECGAAFARHIQRLALRCGEDMQGLPSSLGAGYTVDAALVDEDPPYSTPDRPTERRP